MFINLSITSCRGCHPRNGADHGLLNLLARMIAGAGTAGMSGDSKAMVQRFTELIERNGPTISRLCFAFAASRTDFDDLRQDVMVNLWRGLPKFRGDAAESTWVYRITLNTCVSTVRHSKSRPSTSPLDDIVGRGLQEPDDEADARRREQVDHLHRLIAQLAPADRSIILLWLDEHPYDEIAAIMDLPRNTVATRLRRARERLNKLNQKI